MQHQRFISKIRQLRVQQCFVLKMVLRDIFLSLNGILKNKIKILVSKTEIYLHSVSKMKYIHLMKKYNIF